MSNAATTATASETDEEDVEEEESTQLSRKRKVDFMARTAIVLMLEMDNEIDEDNDRSSKIDHRKLPHQCRRVYKHGEAYHCIMRDYLGPDPIFEGREFETMFRISRSHFQCIMEDIGNAEIPFYLNSIDGFGKKGASFEARLLLPLKCLAYGVPSHTFRDYFQMSKTLANVVSNSTPQLKSFMRKSIFDCQQKMI